MRHDEDRPQPAAGPLSEAELQMLGIDELKAHMASLRSQIEACERHIAAKQSQRALAESVFSKRADEAGA